MVVILYQQAGLQNLFVGPVWFRGFGACPSDPVYTWNLCNWKRVVIAIHAISCDTVYPF